MAKYLIFIVVFVISGQAALGSSQNTAKMICFEHNGNELPDGNVMIVVQKSYTAHTSKSGASSEIFDGRTIVDPSFPGYRSRLVMELDDYVKAEVFYFEAPLKKIETSSLEEYSEYLLDNATNEHVIGEGLLGRVVDDLHVKWDKSDGIIYYNDSPEQSLVLSYDLNMKLTFCKPYYTSP